MFWELLWLVEMWMEMITVFGFSPDTFSLLLLCIVTYPRRVGPSSLGIKDRMVLQNQEKKSDLTPLSCHVGCKYEQAVWKHLIFSMTTASETKIRHKHLLGFIWYDVNVASKDSWNAHKLDWGAAETVLLGLILICGQRTKFGLQCLVKNLFVMPTNLSMKELSWQAVFTGCGCIYRVYYYYHHHRHQVLEEKYTFSHSDDREKSHCSFLKILLFIPKLVENIWDCYAFTARMRIKRQFNYDEIKAFTLIFCHISHFVAF